MINKKEYTEEITRYEIESKTCDKCKKTYNDIFEMQEFHHIRFTGGYGSVFGDESNVETDICQHCLYDMIEDFCRIDGMTNKEYNKLYPKSETIQIKPLTDEQKLKVIEKFKKLKEGKNDSRY